MNNLLPALRLSLLGAILALGPVAAAHAGKTPADQLIVGMSLVNLFSIDPANAPGLDASGVNANLYDTLVKRDNGNPEQHLPQLASSWKVSEDGKQITFTLRDDVRFHSGNPLTAEDVAFSLYRVMKLNYGLATTWKAYGYSVDNIQSLIRATDAQTLVIDLPQPTDPLLLIDSLATSPSAVVVDRQTVLKHEKDGDLGAAWLVTNEAGSGPFTLTRWNANDSLLMTRFDGYWGGPAKLKRVVVRHMTESQSLRLMLERGDLDLAYGMAAPDIKAIDGSDKLQVQSLQRGTMYYVALSMKQPQFADPKVREAVRNLIDYQGLDRQVMPYYGKLNQQPMQLGLAARLPDPGYKMDVAKAKALLAEAGYPQGFTTTIRTLSEPPFTDIAARLQATLAEGGIKASIVSGTGNQVYGAMRARNFEIIVARGAERYPHPYFSLRTFAYNPDNRDDAGLPNFQGWRASFFNPQLNGLIDQAGVERDAGKRVALYHQAQSLYDREVGPIMMISQMTDTVVSNAEVKGFSGDDAEATRYLGVYKQRGVAPRPSTENMPMIANMSSSETLKAQPGSPGSSLDALYRSSLRVLRLLLRNPMTLIGLVVALVLVVVAAFAPWIATHDPVVQNLANALQAPSAAHWFGTDEYGRDIFSRLVYGARITLYIIALVTIIVGPIGLFIGTVSGYFGGVVDTVFMRLTDIFISFPSLVLALAFIAALGPGLEHAVVAIALTSWPPIARLARAETLSLRKADFVVAVQLQGASASRIILKHIVPMCLSSVIIRLTMNMAGIILTAAALGFLGLGAQAPLPEWGAMISTGRRYMLECWWLVAVPGAAIMLVSLAFNLLGDGLRDILDPRSE